MFSSHRRTLPPSTTALCVSCGTPTLKTQPSSRRQGNAPSLITFFQLQAASCSNQTLPPCGKREAPMQKSKARHSHRQLRSPQGPCCSRAFSSITPLNISLPALGTGEPAFKPDLCPWEVEKISRDELPPSPLVSLLGEKGERDPTTPSSKMQASRKFPYHAGSAGLTSSERSDPVYTPPLGGALPSEVFVPVTATEGLKHPPSPLAGAPICSPQHSWLLAQCWHIVGT